MKQITIIRRKVTTMANQLKKNCLTLSGWFRKFIKKNNLPDICLHSLRHTNASLLIASGVNLTTVANRFGHANTK